MDRAANRRKCRCGIGKENVLLVFTVLSVVAGVVIGICLWDKDKMYTQRQLSYMRFPGDMFVRMLKMLILPLIVSSIISSLASLDSGTAGRLGLYALLYYFSTTMIAVIIGIVLVVTIQPGKWVAYTVDTQSAAADKGKCISNAVDTILDLLRNLFPDNLVEATTHSLKTCMNFINKTGNYSVPVPSKLVLEMTKEQRATLGEVPEAVKNSGMNILGLVMFSVALGIIISRMQEKGRPLRELFGSLEAASMTLISLVIWYSPLGITSLIATQICSMEDPMQELHRLTGYMITVLAGLGIHGLIVLPLLLLVVGRRNPFKYVVGMLQALLTALGTSSSSATLPLSIKCVEENNGVDPRVARFVLPLGATINMDGTALYEAVAAIYIAQTVGKTLDIGEVILVSLTATLASIGAAGIPQAGIVTMIMVLIAIGLDTKLFILIVPVDFFLDRIRTTVNVHGDSIGAAVVNKLCERELAEEGGNGAAGFDLERDPRLENQSLLPEKD